MADANTAKYIAELTDLAGNTTYPYTKVAAILDFYQYVVSNGGDQTNLKGVKDFSDGLKVNGKNVLVDGDIKPFELVAGGIPGDDIFQINKSGIYYYTNTTKNVPHFEPLENSTGYILSVFQDDPNYGLLFFLGSFTYIEKWAGGWRKFFSPQPVKLWVGNAKKGDTLTIADSASNYRYLRFTVKNINGSYAKVLSTNQNGNDYWITTNGQTGAATGLLSDESHLKLSADGKTFSFISRKSGDIMKGVADNANANLVEIEGIR